MAIGVTTNKDSIERILGIAAGKSYNTLNATQCTITFIPRIFNVSVSLSDHLINVTDSSSGIDFAASRNLTHVLTRQFELIANDQTSLYVSLIGDSFNSSIASYNSSVSSNDPQSPSEASATLAGLTNSVTAMVDDLLVAYSSAQLMIMNDTSLVPATVEVHAFRYGSGLYIYLTFAINTVILLLLAEEALRTRGWKDLQYFDYMDPRSLIIGGSMGGCAIAHAAEEQAQEYNIHHKIPLLSRMVALAQYRSGKLREMAGKVAIFLEFLIISRTIVLAYAPNLALDSQSQIVLAELKRALNAKALAYAIQSNMI